MYEEEPKQPKELSIQKMKLSKILNLVAVAVIVAFTAVGCKKGLQKPTPLPGQGLSRFGDEKPSGVIDTAGTKTTPDFPAPPVNPGNPGTTGTQETPLAPGTPVPKVSTIPETPNGIAASTKDLGQWQAAAEQPFSTETVYFDFDKSNVKPSEIPKLQRVANGMKNYQGKAIRVEGHCDERGTEEYNRALGERRALSIREHLVRLGVDANIIDTISYGEDKPKDPGHNEAAFKQNRRGEFVLLVPPGRQ
ncbi:MAG: peptidoglycan-binding outer rane lipoprotein Pal, OmpA family [Verrucomicrobiales bacterium]|nr:peptidoglycan-binding outer rane lipoprotein Pal, OmpA family [Verrucomicrobiales bacterium]